MRNVLFITPNPSRAMEYVRAAAGLDEVRRLGITQEAPIGGDAEVFDRIQELVGSLIVQAQLPKPGASCSDSYEDDGYIIVRDPDTQVVSDGPPMCDTARRHTGVACDGTRRHTIP